MQVAHEKVYPSPGEKALELRWGTLERAEAFRHNQVLDHVNAEMAAFIEAIDMMFLATADGEGHCDSSFRAGEPGFVHVLDPKTLLYPEYRGNGVMASLGNITENAHVGLLFIDFFGSTVGLHVNGRATLVENEEVLASPALPPSIRQEMEVIGGRHPERWVRVQVEEAYIHCAKHIPKLVRTEKTRAWGSDDDRMKGGDYFQVRAEKSP